MASADFSLRLPASPFQAQGEISPGKDIGFQSTTAGFTLPPLGRWSFAVICPLAPGGPASYPVPVRRPAPLAPRFLRTLPHGHALALCSGRCDLLPPGLTPGNRCPCWAHRRSARGARAPHQYKTGPRFIGRCEHRLLQDRADSGRDRRAGEAPAPRGQRCGARPPGALAFQSEGNRDRGQRQIVAAPLPHHRTCGSASGGSDG